MKKIFVLFFFVFVNCILNAQNADDILNKAAASFKKIKCLKSSYTLKVNESGHLSEHKGCIIIQGNKYVNYFNGTTIWFNGKTMWTLSEENEEVTITQPSSSELINSNPYHFLDSYSKEFNATLINANGNYYVIRLIPKKNNTDIKKILINISKSDYKPTKITLDAKKSSVIIVIKTYQEIRPYNSKSFSFNKNKYPNVEIIDLR